MSSSFLDDTLQSAAPLIDGTINEAKFHLETAQKTDNSISTK